MNYKRLAICLVLPQLAGAIGSAFTMSSITEWYVSLEKPFFTPPNWLFGPMWVTLYLLMGISIYLVWQKVGKTKDFWLFWVHLFFNFIWTPVFFGLRNPGLGLINIIIIWLFIILLIFRFWKIRKVSSYLLIPYLLWVSIAAALNFSIWYLN